LGITQPSLTLALQRLEKQLNVVLLERSKRGVILTRAGEFLSQRSQQLLQDWEREMRQVSQNTQHPTGRYSFGVHSSVAQYMLPHFMPHMLKHFNQLEFDFIHDLSRRITEKVISRQCDFGLVINPVAHPDLVIRKILSDHVTLFHHPDYKGDVLIYDPDLKQSQNLLQKIRKSFNYKRELHSSSLDVIKTLAASQCGAAILPTRVAVTAPELRAFKNAAIFKDELCLIYRVERRKDESLQKILDLIRPNAF
jgi:DNA-binding transcriptional LysR family regulator